MHHGSHGDLRLNIRLRTSKMGESALRSSDPKNADDLQSSIYDIEDHLSSPKIDPSGGTGRDRASGAGRGT